MNRDSTRPRLRRRLLVVAGLAALGAGAGGALALSGGGAGGAVHLTAAAQAPAHVNSGPEAPDSTAPETTTPETSTGAEAPSATNDGPGGYADPAGAADQQTEQQGNN